MLQHSYMMVQVATVLIACGIETNFHFIFLLSKIHVATVLIACGIETELNRRVSPCDKLQQYLSLAVLKLK